MKAASQLVRRVVGQQQKRVGVAAHSSRHAPRPARTLASKFGRRSYMSGVAGSGSGWWLGLVGGALVAGGAYFLSEDHTASAATSVSANGPYSTAGQVNAALPNYTRAEVALHKMPETGIWVTYKDGVYDITQFVEEHPGGRARIMLAAGGSIEAFWMLYQQHVSDEVATILERHRIGNVAVSDRVVATAGAKDPNDPYRNDPERHPALLARTLRPYNAETPPVLLAETLLVPNELHYVRNHLPVPEVDVNQYILEVAIEGRAEPLRLTLKDLQTLFPKHEVDVTIQCAGNRRTDLNKVKEVRGLAWDIGAIGTAKWGGAKLRDVLKHAGLDLSDEQLLSKLQHVHFEGLDRDFEKSYTASIPMEKASAAQGDCLLAYEMNGAPIPRDHGFPVRAIVPGTVGARNVKWLHRVKASAVENDGHWQQNDYKGFSPNIDWPTVDYKTAPAIQDLPIQSAITIPAPNTVLEDGAQDVTVSGYAWAGGGRGIVRVDVSADGGKNWTTASLQRPDQPLTKSWAWTLFSANVPLPSQTDPSSPSNPSDSSNPSHTKHEIICKAIDSSYNSQPDTTAPIWNLRGVLSTSWHRVPVFVPKTTESL